ncbi:hypothetical protein NM688_g8891 [Phlebia brevispora]|uniref:Uncharacterized protein n=1 Tax=Phlebia brevispora TaxID=194682 RepID=A0ACC1RR73_9APHY|nr:hypothetical protein NM688_g8891 [Phlebia brevispora]
MSPVLGAQSLAATSPALSQETDSGGVELMLPPFNCRASSHTLPIADEDAPEGLTLTGTAKNGSVILKDALLQIQTRLADLTKHVERERETADPEPLYNLPTSRRA